jgi:hypothetical protein
MTEQSPIEVIRIIEQPTSRGGVKAEKEARQAELPARVVGKDQEIGFVGTTSSGESKTFSVLAGEGAPTVTGGWVKLAKVTRYQRVSITVPEGFDPLVLTVPILFDSTVQVKERSDVESDIAKLEWMAGRYPVPEGGEITGEPPLVEVYTLGNHGGELAQTNLVPRQFQTLSIHERRLWYITEITWDENPLRDRGAERIRQKAKVQLTEVVVNPTTVQRYKKANESVKNKFRVYKTTSQVNTIKRLAAHIGYPAAWKLILENNKNLGTSATKSLKPGTSVKVPEGVFRPIPK